jgi:mercuric ion transport protein
MTVNQGARMKDRALITTGAVGGVLAALCCATPVLALVLGTVGLGAWLAKADYVLIPAFVLFLALLGLGLYRRYIHRGLR